MAFHPGSLADDWGDYLPLFEGRSTYNTHDVHSCGTYPEDQQVLENAFISNNHSSADDIDRLAYDTNLNAGPCRLSEHSDSVNATAPLQLPAQDDHLLFNSGGWVGNGDESIADSGSYSNLSVETRNQQHLEAHNYSNPSFSQDIDKVSSSNVLKQETNSNDLLTVPSAGAPWHPGSRVRTCSVLCIIVADKSSSSTNKTTLLMLYTISPKLVVPITALPGSISRPKSSAIIQSQLPSLVIYRHILRLPRTEAQVGRVRVIHP
jgi:hypothetical protein